jgi:hypothetical protein
LAKEFGGSGGKGIEAVGDAPVDRVGRIDARGVRLSRWDPGQKRDPLIDRVDWIDCKAALGRGGHNVLAQHQVAHIRRRDHDVLFAGESDAATGVEKPLDLLVDPADRLGLAAVSTEPIPPSACVIGASASADNKAKSSAAEALSPSTPL